MMTGNYTKDLKTVGNFKEWLQQFPDDMPVFDWAGNKLMGGFVEDSRKGEWLRLINENE